MSVTPVGFAKDYRRVRAAPATPERLSDLLGLVGYDAPHHAIARWPLEKRVQAEVYAINVHLRASDCCLRRCPRPEWMPDPWNGPREGEGVSESPAGTRLS